MRKQFIFNPTDLSLLESVKLSMGASTDVEVVRRLLREYSKKEPTVEIPMEPLVEEEPQFKLLSNVWDAESGEMIKTIKRTTKPHDLKFIRESESDYEKY